MPKDAGSGAVLVTGAAGFIGSHLVEKLVGRGERVVALDNFNDFYDPAIKRQNLAGAMQSDSFRLIELDLLSPDLGESLAGEAIDTIVHLAARAGVRPSLARPNAYVDTNVGGTVAVLELARARAVQRVVFGSSSSVYGDNSRVPFTETDSAIAPISPYAATKRAAELLCHTYHHLYGLGIVCLRFFTVYGPRQRPDLAIHKFTRLMTAGEPIPFFGDGGTERDYTYIDDIIQGVVAAIDHLRATPDAFEIVNLGESQVTTLANLVALLEKELGVQASLNRLPAQPGDVKTTFANFDKARALLGYAPSVGMEEGIRRFVEWFRESRLGEPSSRV